MTAPLLLLYISFGLLAQVVAAIAWSMLRKRAQHTVAPPAIHAAGRQVDAGAWAGLRAFRVVRREYEDIAQTQCSFYLEPVDGTELPSFKPGQFLTFSLNPGTAGASLKRCYSLSDKPHSRCYRITIKRALPPLGMPDATAGVVSSYFHDHVHVGSVLKVRAPAGNFFLDSSSNMGVVLIGGGVGITPMMSMLHWCLEHQPQRPVYFYYGVRNSSEHAYKRVLEELVATSPQLHLNVVYSKPGPADQLGKDYQHAGYVDVPLLQRSLPHGTHAFYVCGPPPQ